MADQSLPDGLLSKLIADGSDWLYVMLSKPPDQQPVEPEVEDDPE